MLGIDDVPASITPQGYVRGSLAVFHAFAYGFGQERVSVLARRRKPDRAGVHDHLFLCEVVPPQRYSAAKILLRAAQL